MILYHYTDYTALDGILTGGELRLNNVLNMNDSAELHYFVSGISDAVYERLIRSKDSVKAEAFRSFVDSELKKEYYTTYAACFSAFRDDASQWERYGFGGQGVSIGFDRELFEGLMGGPIALLQVFYETDVSEHALVDELFELLHEPVEFSGLFPRLTKIMNRVWVQSAAFKHPSFAHEGETRLVVSPFGANELKLKPEYHVTRGRIKKYYPLNLNTLCRLNDTQLTDLVCEIIIGPTSTQSPMILQDYLRDRGLSVLADRICLSKCPLRRPAT